MPQQTRVFRVFVSSTFTDMKEERRLLQEKVFPKLEKFCKEKGVKFHAVDLRWGVNEESQLNQKTLDICLHEIQRCQMISPKLNFLILLGNKYGWQPIPTKIPVDEWKAIMTQLDGPSRRLISEWYKKDTNAVPAEFVVQPRGKAYEAYSDWEKTETTIRETLYQAVLKLKLPAEKRVRYFASATHQEILAGALDAKDSQKRTEEHVLAMVREIKDLPKDASADGFIDLIEGQPDTTSEKNLNNLKIQLQKKLGPHYLVYPAQWKNDHSEMDDPGVFANQVFTFLKQIIERQLETSVDHIDYEKNLHKEFKNKLIEHFCGRDEILKDIQDYMNNPSDKRPFCITGASGSGKSSVIARAVDLVEKNNQFVVYRFIGISANSSNIISILQSISGQIASEFNTTLEELAGKGREVIIHDMNGMTEIFGRSLALGTKNKPIVLFLDALDQLTEANKPKYLNWLPQILPDNTRIIVSCLPELESRMKDTNLHLLPPMPYKDGEKILDALLDANHRKLTGNQRMEVLNKFKETGLPLFLKVAFEHAREWRSFDSDVNLPQSITGMVDRFFSKLEHEHSHMLVSKVVGYILSGKHDGLTESEILDVLLFDKQFWRYFLKSTHKDHREEVEKAKKLPVVIWSRLFFDLVSYLAERDSYGERIIGFYHKQFSDILRERYLVKSLRFHETLGEYFERRWDEPYNRALDELPFQLMKSNKYNSLNRLLKTVTFLDNKISANMVYELLLDFALIEEANLDKTLTNYKKFISNRIQYFIQDPLYFLPELYSEHVPLHMQEPEVKKIKQMLTNRNLPWLEPKSYKSLSESYIMEPVLAITFSNDGSIIAMGDTSNMITIWDGELKSIKTRFYKPARSRRGSAFNSLFILDDNQHLLCVFNNGEIHTISLETGITTNTSGKTTDDTAKVYKAENYLLLVPPFDENHDLKIYQIDELYLREIECNFPPGEDLPIWVGPQMLCVSLNQTVYDLKKKTKIGRLNLQSVPPKYKCEPFITSTPPYIILDDSTCLHVGEKITFHRYSTGDILKSFNTNDLFENNDKRRPEFIVCHKKKKVVFWMHNILVSVDMTNFRYNKISFDMKIQSVVHNPKEEFLYLSLYDGDLIYSSKLFELKVIGIDSFTEIHSQKCPPMENPNILINKGGPYIILNNEKMMDVEKDIEIATLPKDDKFWTNTQHCDPFLGYNETKELVY